MLAVVTGSGGLVGSAVTTRLLNDGWHVAGIDNDARRAYFGAEASTRPVQRQLAEHKAFRPLGIDVTSRSEIIDLYRRGGVALTIHCAAQPSHDYSAADPVADFRVNTEATAYLLDAHRHYTRDGAPFVYMSTNKVYGDYVNGLPFRREEARLDLAREHRYHRGIPETFPIDHSLHSPFGAHKLASDVMVQEYGRYYGIPTTCLRGGTLTGGAHQAARLHGFLAYLVRSVRDGQPYTIEGHHGLQVRDVLHADDVASAIIACARSGIPGAVYNLGGARERSVSVLEALAMAEAATGRAAVLGEELPARRGDHRWWVSDVTLLEETTGWSAKRSVASIIAELAATT